MKYLWPLVALVFFVSCIALDAADYLTEGQKHEEANDPVKAIQSYLTGVKSTPSEELYVAAARLMGKMKKYDRGEKLVDEALKKYPESLSLLKLAALFKTKLGNEKDARALSERLQKAESPQKVENAAAAPDPLPAAGSLELLPEVQQATAAAEIIIELQKVDHDNVAAFEAGLRRIVFTCPTSPHAPAACWKLANLYLFSASDPDYEKALPILEKFITDYPNSPGIAAGFARLKSIAEAGENYALLLKTAREAQKHKFWSAEEMNFWRCHEAAAMIRVENRDSGLQRLQQIVQSSDITPRVAEYADYLIKHF